MKKVFALISLLALGGLNMVHAEKGAALLMNSRIVEPVSSRVVGSSSALIPPSRRAEWQAAAKAGDLTAKQRISEELAEEATRNVAKSRGHTPLLDDASLPYHGPDVPTIDSEGRIHLYEAKGGGSEIKTSYGYPQGTPENGVAFYKELLKRPSATAKQKEVAKFVLSKAAEGKVDAHVVRLQSVLGQPEKITIIDRDCTPAARKLAQDFFREEQVVSTSVPIGKAMDIGNVSNIGKTSAVVGIVASVVQARDGVEEVRQGETVMGSLNLAGSAANATSVATGLAGRVLLSGGAGAAGAGVDGAIDIYSGIKNHDSEKTTVGGVKSAAAITMAVGVAQPELAPVLMPVGAIIYGGAVVTDVFYENQEAIAETCSDATATARIKIDEAASTVNDRLQQLRDWWSN